MTDMQMKLLPLLEFFHRFCEENHLRYYAIGGTALGAMRHGGFIPWDDDLDVGMPRPDYERLKELVKDADMGQFRFEFPGEHPDFVYPFGKMYDTSTTLVENTRYQTKRGIYLDIFPLDGIGDTYEESLANFRPILRKNNLLSTQVCAWRKGRRLYKNLAMLLLRHLPGLSMQSLMTDIDRLSKRFEFDRSVYVANCVGNWYEKEIAKREWLGIPQLCKFEHLVICCPENADAYLTAVYGDWRTPPPLEKQVSHHDFLYLDLHTPYGENNSCEEKG